MAIIQNENDKILQASTNRLTAVAVALEPSSTVFIKSRNIAGTKPTSIELKTAITGYNNTPDYKWKYRPTLLSTWTTMPAATAAALSYSVFNTQRGESNGVEYKVTTSKSGWEEASDQSTIEYKSTSNDLPVVTISRPSISLPASGEGVCDYSNTATVITVTIDKVSLTYNNVLGPNTFNVVASVSRGTATLGINTDGSFGSISGMNGTPLTATAEITYTVTSRDVDNNEKVDVIKQTISKVASGTASTITYLSATADTIVKDAVSAAQSGKHSTTLVRGYSKTGNSLAQLYGYVSTQLGSKAVGNRINSSNILDTPISDSENILDVTYKLYATVSSTEVLDTEIIPILFKNSNSIVVNLTNDSCSIPVNSSNTAGVYTNAGTDIHVYQGATELVYDTLGTIAGTWKISSNTSGTTGISPGSLSSSTSLIKYAIAASPSNITAAVATIRYTITGTDLKGVAFSVTKDQTFSRIAAGIDAAIGQLSNDSHVLPILVSGTPNYVGCNTTMTVSVGAKDDSNNWTFIPTTSTGVICSSTNSGRTQTISQVTAALSTVTIVAKHKQYVYSDVTCIFTITKGQAGGITANLSNDTHVVPVTTAGVADYTGCNTTMTVYVAGIDDSTNWNYVVTTSTGVICSSTNSGRTQTVSQVTAAVSTVTIVASKANYSDITCIFTITKAKQGDTGAKGDEATKAVTLSIFKWAASTQTTSSVQSTLTWSTNTATPIPSDWDTAAITSPGSGYTLYMWSVTVTALASVTSTTFNWSTGSIGSIGYRQDGSIGIQGAGARKAYTVVTSTPPDASGTPIGVPVTIGGDEGPGSIWSTTLPTVSTSTASTTYTLWVVDGNYYPSGSPSYSNQTVWGSPYLATFKVDSLQAVSANVGVLNIASGGNIHSGKASSADDTTAGFFLGNDSGTPKFSVGSSAKYLTWNGTDLDIKGAIKGDSSIDITGSAIFGGVYSGSYAPSGHSVALSANPNSTANAGIYARSGSASSMAVWASGAALGSTGVYATCTSTGTAGKFYPSTGGTGISSNGPSDFDTIRCDAAAGVVPISVTYSTTMCTNLNANYLGGELASAFSLTGHNHSDVYATATHNHIGVYCNGAITDAGYTGVNTTSGLTFTSSTISGYRFSSVVGSATVRYEATSDRRLKEAIVPEKLGIEFILKLKPVRYKLRTGPIDFHGFIAQDLDDIDLDSTNDSLRITNEDGTRGIDYVSLISPIVKALQELTSKVSILEVELQELKNGKL